MSPYPVVKHLCAYLKVIIVLIKNRKFVHAKRMANENKYLIIVMIGHFNKFVISHRDNSHNDSSIRALF